MLADQHSLVVRKVPNVGVGPCRSRVHASRNQSPGISIRQFFALSFAPAKMPCFIGSPELLGPQERNNIVVLRLRCIYEGHLQLRPGVPGSAGWKTPRT